MNNPGFTRSGIPVRFPVDQIHGLAERNLIIARAEESLDEMPVNPQYVSHIKVSLDRDESVTLTAFAIPVNIDCTYFQLGRFRFTDRISRPLYLEKVKS